MSTSKVREREEAIFDLRAIVAPGDTVYTVLRHVSRSGMYRALDLYVYRQSDAGECEPRRITWSAARATDNRYDTRHDALGITGCGMDMGFQAVYTLSASLFPEGFGCIGERCPSNDHSNGDRDYTADGSGVDHWHRSGGYALQQRWQ